MNKKRTKRKLPVWKTLLYGSFTCAAFFVIVELLLALFGVQPVLQSRDPFVGFESTIPLFVEQSDGDGRVTFVTAKNKLAYFNPQQFPKYKARDAYRIFCLGGSTTYGRPYDDTMSFPGWLRELLPVADPSRQWEVINAGGISYASYRVAALMDELATYQPDLFIIYTGHNEFLEERTYRELKQSPAALRRLTSLLGRTRTFSLGHSILRPSSESESHTLMPSEVDAKLDHTVGPSDYARDDELRDRIVEHFEFNLTRMIGAARDAGAEVLLVVPTSNVKDCSPFKSQHRGDLTDEQLAEWTAHFERGQLLETAGSLDEAIDAYRQAAAIDDRYAELHFRMGRVSFELRRLVEARAALDRAVEEDVCPLRALARIRDIVMWTGERLAVPVLDAEELLKFQCLRSHGHNSPGREFFLDHVHPTVATNGLIAVSLIDNLIDQRIVKPGPTWNEPSIDRVAARIEAKIDPKMQAVSLRNLAKVLNWAGKHDEAGPLALQAVELRTREALADDPEALLLAGAYLRANDKIEAAIQCFERSLSIDPDYVEVHQLLGAVLVERKQFDAALSQFLEVIRLKPEDSHAQHMAGAVLAELRRYDQAIDFYIAANRLAPNDPHIHYNMAFALEQLGQHRQAIEWYQKTLQLDPHDQQARRNLENLLVTSNE